MSAVLIPFPLHRRQDLVTSIVARVLRMNAAAGEQHIQRSLELQATVMRRRGIGESLVACERKRLEAAIRTGIWIEVFQPRETR